MSAKLMLMNNKTGETFYAKSEQGFVLESIVEESSEVFLGGDFSLPVVDKLVGMCFQALPESVIDFLRKDNKESGQTYTSVLSFKGSHIIIARKCIFTEKFNKTLKTNKFELVACQESSSTDTIYYLYSLK